MSGPALSENNVLRRDDSADTDMLTRLDPRNIFRGFTGGVIQTFMRLTTLRIEIQNMQIRLTMDRVGKRMQR